jgi:C-terminal processing protease CtpA/Prc
VYVTSNENANRHEAKGDTSTALVRSFTSTVAPLDTFLTHRQHRTPLRRLLRSGVFSGLALAACASAGDRIGSIGAILVRDAETGIVEIHEVPPGRAAEHAGLYVGDDIKMIDGLLVDDLDATRIQRLLRGPVGSTVVLTVIRGDEVLEIEIERQELGTTSAPRESRERIE